MRGRVAVGGRYGAAVSQSDPVDLLHMLGTAANYMTHTTRCAIHHMKWKTRNLPYLLLAAVPVPECTCGCKELLERIDAMVSRAPS